MDNRRHRISDPDETDFGPQRRPISGEEQELSVGAGKYRLTLKGSQIIAACMSLAVLLAIGWHLREQEIATQRILAHISSEMAAATRELSRTSRLQTCVLSMTTEERIQWRQSRGDSQQALFVFCPGLLIQ